MKKLTLLCLMAGLAITASAQINYTDLIPDSSYTITPTGTFSADSAIWLDIDGDNTDDFYFQYEYVVGFAGVTWKVQTHCIDPNNQIYWKSTATSFGNHYIKQLNKGDSITKNVLFGADTDPLLGDHIDNGFVGMGDKYIGIKFKSGSNTYYGWMLVNLSFGTSSGTMVVKSYAYNTTPGDGLNAGDTCLVTTSTTVMSDCNSVTWNGTTYNKSGTYTYTTTNSIGCDSIAKLVFTLNKTFETVQQSACDSITVNSTTYYTSGTYLQTLTNSLGCDSLLTLVLTIKESTDSIMNINACDSFELNGMTYYTGGNYTQHLTNSKGCDSTINLILDIKKSTTSNVSASGCDSVIVNGTTFTATGLYFQTITNMAGCDSVITLNVNINKSSVTNLTEVACDSFTLNDSTYYQSGVYTQVFTDVNGCDSSLVLNLTINQPTSETITESACSDYTLNDSTYDKSGTYVQTITNAAGCDSIITLVLTIGSLNKTVVQDHNTLTAQATGVDYQWLDCDDGYSEISGETDAVFTPTVNGNYAVEITDGTCTDTSNCFAVTKVGIEYTTFPSSIIAYPNPTGGEISIDLGATYTNVTVKVYNTLGELVNDVQLSSAKEIDLNLVSEAGVYYINVTNGNYSARLKVMKQ